MIDKNDATWTEVESAIKALIEESTLALKSPVVPWDIVQIHRGKILAFEELLRLPETFPVDAPAGPSGY